MDQPGLDSTVLLDREAQALKAWKGFADPTRVVIDKQGRIRYALLGAIA